MINKKFEKLNEQLLLAAEKGDVALMLDCLRRGADVNARDKDGRTVLMWLALSGHLALELLEVLVSRGADINASDENGWTVMMWSVHDDHLTLELLEALVSRGADVNARDKEGKTVLVFAARYNYLTLELLEALVSRGADVNASNKYGRTAIILAAQHGHLTLELLEALVSRGADASACDSNGWTALMRSARNGYLTPELALALCRKMRASGTPVKELWRQMTTSGSTAGPLVSVLTEWLRTDPGEVVDLLSAPEEKKRINEWRTGNLPGMDELFRNAAECMTEEAFFRVFDEETQTEKERAVLKRGLGRIFVSDRTCGGADKPCAFARGER